MATEQEQQQTPAMRALLRTGACTAVGCKDCPNFVYHSNMDGFRMCACNHTQHVHRFGNGKAA